MKLEELARQSAESARVSVAHLRPLETARPERSRWIMPVAAMATLLAVVGLAISFTRGGGDDPAETTLAGAPDVPRLGIAAQPGWSLLGAYDDSSVGDVVTSDITFWGAADGDDPFGAGDVLVSLRKGFPGEDVGGSESTSIVVHGVAGRVMDADDGMPPGLSGIEWVEPGSDGSTVVQMLSRSLTSDQIVALADRSPYVAPTSDSPDDLGRIDIAPEDGYVRLATTDGLGPFILSVPGSGSSSVIYEGSSSETVLVFTTAAGNLDDEVLSLRWFDPSAHRVQVDGQPGWIGTIDLSGDLDYVVQALAWTPAPGVVAYATATNADLPEAELIRLAEAAEPLTDAEFEAAIAKLQQPSEPDTAVYTEVWAQGEGQVGDTPYNWIIGRQGDAVCMDVNISESGSGSCSAGGEIDVAGFAQVYFQNQNDMLNSVAIVATSEVDDVVPSADGGELHNFDQPDGTSWWLWFGPADVDVTFDVIVNGQTVATLDAATQAEEIGSEVGGLEVDLSSNSAAQALGIVDTFVPEIQAGTDSQLVVGTVDGDLCVVALADVDVASCAPGDIVVVKPFTTPTGAERTVVMMRLPCPAVSLDNLSLVGLVGAPDDFGATSETMAVLTTDRSVTDLQLVATVGGRAVRIDLPDVEGSADWPADICS